MATKVGEAVVGIKFDTSSLRREMAQLQREIRATVNVNLRGAGGGAGAGALGGGTGIGSGLVAGLVASRRRIRRIRVTERDLDAAIAGATGATTTRIQKLKSSVKDLKFEFMNLTRGVGGLLKIGTAFVAIKTTIDAAIVTLKEFSTAQELINQSQKLFGRSLPQIEKVIQAYKGLGLAENDIRRAANSLQSLFGQFLGESEGAAMTEELLDRIVDTVSFTDRGLMETARAFQSAMVGNTEALRSFNIVFTESEVTARALEKAGKSNVTQLTQQERLQARIELIMQRSAAFAGDFKDTMDSMANASKRVEGAWSNILKDIGGVVNDIFKVEEGLNTFATSLAAQSDFISDSFARITGAVKLILIPLSAVTMQIKALFAALGALSATGSMEEAMKAMSAEAEAWVDGIGRGIKAIKDGADDTIEVTDGMFGDGETAADNIAKKMGRMVSSIRGGAKSLSDMFQEAAGRQTIKLGMSKTAEKQSEQVKQQKETNNLLEQVVRNTAESTGVWAV